jgi:hypothetical protein
MRLTDPERTTLAEIGKRLGRKALRAVACVAKPETILTWYRRLVAAKFDGSKHRQYPGRPRVRISGWRTRQNRTPTIKAAAKTIVMSRKMYIASLLNVVGHRHVLPRRYRQTTLPALLHL